MWAKNIEDEGAAVFIAFASRIASQYGYDIQYYISMDDVGRMSNRVANGLVEWLRSHQCIKENMRVGKLLDDVVAFSLSAPGKSITQADLRKRQRAVEQFSFELTEDRQKLIWAYLLGCLHKDLVTDQPVNFDQHGATKNSHGIKEFQLTREYKEYVPRVKRNG
jgi:hypothetical protein